MKIFAINNKVFWYNEYAHIHSVGAIYKSLSIFRKITREFLNFFKISIPSMFYTDSFMDCGKTEDTIIIFNSPLTIAPANYIKSKFPNLRVIYWFWNHISNPKWLTEINNNIEKWTYDPEDAAKYGLRLNTQFYLPHLVEKVNSESSEYTSDCFFIGKEKGRNEIISSTHDLLESIGLSTYFHVASDKKISGANTRIPYDTILNYIKSTKSIVDLLPPTQKGMSLRPLEALFFEKKLITNFQGIVKESLYNRRNIFILGEDDIASLRSFVHEPYFPIDKRIKEYYSFNSWINRFSE